MPKQTKKDAPKLGAKVRALRRRENLTQAALARNLGISASYLNLIESNRRPLPAGLLIELAHMFDLDIHAFAAAEDSRLEADLLEAFADPLFDSFDLTTMDIRDLAANCPSASRAVLALYRKYQTTRTSAESLATKVTEGKALLEVEGAAVPSEEVSDFIQKHMNHFPELEVGAEELWAKAKMDTNALYAGLTRYLERHHGVKVNVMRWGNNRGVLRRYDPDKQVLTLSELLPTRSRKFQLACQIALLSHRQTLDRLVSDPLLTSDESRRLARVALGNYFAGCVMMPYADFAQAARSERYDIDVLGRRYRVGFEQVCHRLTTLRRQGDEGVPFHMIRIDVAGNISKRFSASGIRFARFSGACPRWNVFAAFMTPGMIRIQKSRMPDGARFFCIARTIHKDSGGFHSQKPVMAIGLGCESKHARELIYSDGVDVDSQQMETPVGVTCRLCERQNCEQRAVPSVRHPLRIDENVRGLSLYNPVPASE